jgi:hypothetical protein
VFVSLKDLDAKTDLVVNLHDSDFGWLWACADEVLWVVPVYDCYSNSRGNSYHG